MPSSQTITCICTLPICTMSLTFSGRCCPGVDAGAVDVGAIGAIEIFDDQRAALKVDASVLARTPNAVGWLLVFEIDVDWLFVGTAKEVRPVVDGVLDADFLAAFDLQLGLRPGGEILHGLCGSRGWRRSRWSWRTAAMLATVPGAGRPGEDSSPTGVAAGADS